jgi:outer membrane protein assembly factor BamE (lipoprotein component of BamABCDE complex)
VKLWNCSSPAVDVYFDFTVWYYVYEFAYHEQVMAILQKQPTLLENIQNLLTASIAQQAGKLPPERLVAILENVK